MDSDQLERWQLEKISEKVGDSLRYLTRLKHRMEKAGFGAQDPLFQRVDAAQAAAQHLFMECHYLSATAVWRGRNAGQGAIHQTKRPPPTT